MDVALLDSQDRESQSNEGMLDDLQVHARKLQQVQLVYIHKYSQPSTIE